MLGMWWHVNDKTYTIWYVSIMVPKQGVKILKWWKLGKDSSIRTDSVLLCEHDGEASTMEQGSACCPLDVSMP